jgi:hypothetical protein
MDGKVFEKEGVDAREAAKTLLIVKPIADDKSVFDLE